MPRHTRREFLRRAALLAALPFHPEPPVTRRPNILVILSDDQPYYTMGYMPKALAHLEQGLEFTEAYVASPLCSPSRCTIHTGRHSHTHGVTLNGGAARRFARLGWPSRSVGNLLHTELGYECGYFGKWMNGYEDISGWRAQGYSSWAAVLANRDPVWANVDGRPRLPKWPGAGGNRIARKDETRWLGEKALSFMQKASSPWFCFASIKAPHSPYDPSNLHKNEYASEPFPHASRANFDHQDPRKPAEVSGRGPLTDDEKDHMRTAYRGKLEEMQDLDDQVDALLDAVDFEDTYVFYLSDNGFFLGEHRLYAKGKPYVEAIKTPFFVRGPGMRQDDSTDLLASNTDIAPTMLELAGMDPVQEGMDGRSLVGPMVGPQPFIDGEDQEPPELAWRERMLLEMPDPESSSGGWHAIHTGTKLYVEHLRGRQATGERELYDMVADPLQTDNVADDADDAEIFALSQALEAMRDATGQDLRDAEEA